MDESLWGTMDADKICRWLVWIEQWAGRLYLARPMVRLKVRPLEVAGK